MAPASSSPSPDTTGSLSSSAALSPCERACRAAATAASEGTANGVSATGAAAPRAVSVQAVSAGRISVATPPGADCEAATASAAASPTSSAVSADLIHCETGAAKPAMSLASGASSVRWLTAWSPTMLTTGERARRALCRLARPFARPGPRCSSVQAGLRAIRA